MFDLFKNRFSPNACSKFLILVLTLLGANKTLQAQAPSGTWEHWLKQIHAGKKPTPSRPDNKNLMMVLPLWVDCHLSWLSDQPKNKIPLPDQIILHSNSKTCANQMERWSR